MARLTTLHDKIYDVLKTRPSTRDCDMKLCAEIWRRELQAIDNGLFSEQSFLSRYQCGELPSAESITRIRRLQQQKHEELRGAKYESRCAEYEKDFRDKLRETGQVPF